MSLGAALAASTTPLLPAEAAQEEATNEQVPCAAGAEDMEDDSSFFVSSISSSWESSTMVPPAKELFLKDIQEHKESGKLLSEINDLKGFSEEEAEEEFRFHENYSQTGDHKIRQCKELSSEINDLESFSDEEEVEDFCFHEEPKAPSSQTGDHTYCCRARFPTDNDHVTRSIGGSSIPAIRPTD